MINRARQDERRSGFTLVELMIVVGIIGILASIAIPAFQGYIKKARRSEAFGILEQGFTGAAAYYATDFVREGIGGGAYSGCVVTNTLAWIPAFPREVGVKKVGDFGSDTAWTGLGVTNSEPMYYSYFVGSLGPANPFSMSCLPGSLGLNYIFVALSPFRETSGGNAMFDGVRGDGLVTESGIQRSPGYSISDIELSLAGF